MTTDAASRSRVIQMPGRQRMTSDTPSVEKLLARIPVDSGITFTDEQLEVVDLAFSNWNGVHPIDIRCSIPIWRRFYISLVVGPEKRTEERLEENQEAHPLMIFGNIVLIAVSITAVGLALMLYSDGLTHILKESWFLFMQQVSAVRDFLLGI